MTDFNLRTSYATDYELVDFTEWADWGPENGNLTESDDGWRDTLAIQVAEISDVNNPDYINVTLGVSLSPTSKVFVCWSPDDSDVESVPSKSFQPQVNDVIETDEAESAYPGRWLVNNVATSPFSHWVLLVDKGRANAD